MTEAFIVRTTRMMTESLHRADPAGKRGFYLAEQGVGFHFEPSGSFLNA